MPPSKPKIALKMLELAASKAALYLAVMAWVAGCQMTAPVGPLPLQWGEDAQTSAQRLGLTSIRWQRWIHPEFEIGTDQDHPQMMFGAEGTVSLVRSSGGKLEGVQVTYPACANDGDGQRRLRDQLRRDLQLESSSPEGPYKSWNDKSLARFAADAVNGTCVLTIAGPRFGPAFSGALIREGFQNLRSGMGPH